MGSTDAKRRAFAEQLRVRVPVRSPALVAAFAAVPREQFLGPGPWWISEGGGYRRTPDDDPRHVYADVRVAIDPERELNNGRPFTHAAWIDRLELGPGDHAVHVGAGTGYYSAILAELVGPRGCVTALEVDAALARQLRENLSHRPWVEAIHASGADFDFGAADAIYVNAGATHPASRWLDRLREGGTMILPLTEMGRARHGGVLWIRRQSSSFAAEFISSVRAFPCEGVRDERAEALLAAAFERGGQDQVRSLRRGRHEPGPDCWLHAETYCLSWSPPPTAG